MWRRGFGQSSKNYTISRKAFYLFFKITTVIIELVVVACWIIVSVPFLYLWTLDLGFRIWTWDLDLGLGFGTWIWDLDLGLGFNVKSQN